MTSPRRRSASSISMRSTRSPARARTPPSRGMSAARACSRRCSRSWRAQSATCRPTAAASTRSQEFIQINTKNILFICGGAFDGLEKLIQRRTDNASMGFGSQLRTTLDKDETRQKLLKKVEPDDLVKFGLIPELIGRMPVVTVLDPLDEDTLVRVLTEPKNSIVRQYKELLHLDNAELVFTDAALHAIARKTVERKSGARGLRSVVEDLLIPIMYEIPSDTTITKVTIDADTVEGGAPHIEHGMMRPRYKNLALQSKTNRYNA